MYLGCETGNQLEYAEDPYSNPSFCLAMQKRVEATKIIQLGIFQTSKDGPKEIENHKLSPLLEKVSASVTWGEFIDYVLNWSLGKDNGVLIEKLTGIPSMAPDLIAYNPDNFTVTFDSSRIVRIDISNPHRIIEGDDLKKFLWLKGSNYYLEVAGVSPGTQGTGLANTSAMTILGSYIKKIWGWNFSLASTKGKAGAIISSKEGYSMDDKTANELKEKYQAMTTGENIGGVVVINSPVDYKETGNMKLDLDWEKGELTAHERICLSLGVPPELVGSGESTYANRKEAKKELYTDTIIPWYQDFIRGINKLLEKELAGAFIDLKIGSIEALKADKTEELKALELSKDRLTINEYRKEYSRITGIALNDVENGDEIIIGNDTLSNLVTDIGGTGDENVEDLGVDEQ